MRLGFYCGVSGSTANCRICRRPSRPARRLVRPCPETAGRSCRHSGNSGSLARCATVGPCSCSAAWPALALRHTRAWWLCPNAHTRASSRSISSHAFAKSRPIWLVLSAAVRRASPCASSSGPRRAVRGSPRTQVFAAADTRSCQSRSRLPTIATSRDLADALHAAVVVAAAEVVAQKGQSLRARRRRAPAARLRARGSCRARPRRVPTRPRHRSCQELPEKHDMGHLQHSGHVAYTAARFDGRSGTGAAPRR